MDADFEAKIRERHFTFRVNQNQGIKPA